MLIEKLKVLKAARVLKRRAALLFLIAACFVQNVEAHPVPFSYLDVRFSAGNLECTLVAHIVDLAHDLDVTSPESLLDPRIADSKREVIADILRERLVLIADGQPLDARLVGIEPLVDRQALKFELKISADRAPSLLIIKCNLFPYDSQHQTFLNIYDEGRLVNQAILSHEHQTFDYQTGVRQDRLSVLKRFIPAGIYHIFTGPDHILFLVGLLLVGGRLRRLLTIVTAFTIAHSVTLSLAALNVINPSPRVIEPAIALSIVYVGIDNLMVGESGRDMRAWIAFFFGFVHGFGFAGVLREFGLPRDALGWSLFSFNFGVEIGQAVIVIVVAYLLSVFRKRTRVEYRKLLLIGSACVIIAGSYWFIQRVFFYGSS